MQLADFAAAVLWIGLTLYAVLGGSDFGGGFWDLLAGDAQRGARARALIERSIGPVWEANHVWLIFGAVILWTGFPTVFASVMSTAWIPLLLAAGGIILRGAAFVFRKGERVLGTKRVFGGVFALSSVVTPYFLGAVVGGVASGRVPLGNAAGDPFTTWLNPTSVLSGVLATITCAHLAAVYLCADARRGGDDELAEGFRLRGIVSGLVVGAVSLAGVLVLRADAPHIFAGIMGRALPAVAGSMALGLASLLALWRRSYLLARPLAAGAVTVVIWGWGLAQYPDLLPGSCTLEQAAADPASLRAILASLGVGALILIPSMIWLLVLAQRHTGTGKAA